MWQVAWAHPKYGHILASCSYDGKVLIWKEQQGGSAVGGWIKIKEHTLHTASGNPEFILFSSMASTLSFIFFPLPVNSVSWAPHELGAILACASSRRETFGFDIQKLVLKSYFSIKMNT